MNTRPIPTDILIHEICEPYSSYSDVCSLICTSSLFSNHLNLQKIKEEKLLKQKRWKSFEYKNSSCWLDQHSNKLYQLKNLSLSTKESVELDVILEPLPLPLDADEVILDVLPSSCSAVVLTNKNRIMIYHQYDDPQVVTLPPDKMIATITGSSNHYFILSECNALYGFGRNTKGELGLGPNHDKHVVTPELVNWGGWEVKPKQMIAGEGFSLILTESNTLYGFGDNQKGQIGLAKDIDCIDWRKQIVLPNQKKPEKIIIPVTEYYGIFSTDFTFVVTQSGKLCGFGKLPKVIQNLPGIKYDHRYNECQYSPIAIPLPFEDMPEKIYLTDYDLFIQCQNGKLHVISGISGKHRCIESSGLGSIKEIYLTRSDRSQINNYSLILFQSGKLYKMGKMLDPHHLEEIKIPNNAAVEKVINGKLILCKNGNIFGLNVEYFSINNTNSINKSIKPLMKINMLVKNEITCTSTNEAGTISHFRASHE